MLDTTTVPTLSDMSDDEITAYIDQLRVRRLEPARIYEEVRQAREQAGKEATAGKLDRALERLQKKLTKIDKDISDAEAIAQTVRILQLELLD